MENGPGLSETGAMVSPPLAIVKSNRRIVITPLSYGYTVNIDCQTFAIESKKDLIIALSAFLENPVTVEQDWMG